MQWFTQLGLSPAEAAVWLATIAVTASAVVRLIVERLATIYPCFLGYLFFDLLQSAVALTLGPRHPWYRGWFLLTVVCKCILYVLVAREIWGHTLRDYPALATLGRKALLVAGIVTAALGFMLAGVLPVESAQWQQDPWYRRTMLVERGVVSLLAIFWFLQALFLAWFPVQIRRNVIVYSAGFVLYFAAKTVAVVAALLLAGSAIRVSSLVAMFVNLICVSCWLAGMSAQGEELHRRGVMLIRSAEEREQLLEKLGEINGQMDKMLKK